MPRSSAKKAGAADVAPTFVHTTCGKLAIIERPHTSAEKKFEYYCTYCCVVVHPLKVKAAQ